MRRCFVCAAAMLEPTGRALTYPTGRRRAFSRACGSCGVLLAEGADPAACRAHLTRHLAASIFLSDETAPYGLDLYTLRIAATRLGRGIRALDAQGRAALRHPHDAWAARADCFALDGESRRPVSLGLLCRPAELDPVLAALPGAAGWTDDVAILLDGPASLPQAVPAAGFRDGAVRVASRPLDGD
ncbi:MAG: hypothetical protein INR70_16560, partial [Parafilimonas terrae]|nr:hypothetical protein [Parafilimonas terrae]